jgi:hypothetical protein
MIYLVMGYGCHLTKKIIQYLDFVLGKLQDGDIVITSGGFTQQKSAPGISEAGVMRRYLKEKCFKDITFLKEENSITTYQNLKNCLNIISKLKHDMEIIIVCDSSRLIKIWIMSLFIFKNQMPKIITQDLSNNLFEKIMQIFIATPLDLMAEVFPFLKKMKEERKRRLMKIS